MTTSTLVAFDKWWDSVDADTAKLCGISRAGAYNIYLQGQKDALQCEIDRLEAAIETDESQLLKES